MPSARLSERRSLAESVLRPVDGNDRERPEIGEGAADHHRAEGPLRGQQQRAEAVQTGRSLQECVRTEGPAPSDPGGVRLGVGIGILADNELEGVHVLSRPRVPEGEFAA